jgi:hypothetical protein
MNFLCWHKFQDSFNTILFFLVQHPTCYWEPTARIVTITCWEKNKFTRDTRPTEVRTHCTNCHSFVLTKTKLLKLFWRHWAQRSENPLHELSQLRHDKNKTAKVILETHGPIFESYRNDHRSQSRRTITAFLLTHYSTYNRSMPRIIRNLIR